MKKGIENFHLPRYKEIPNVGLYLEQTVKYINESLEPLGYSITSSMLSNYVKQGYISRPLKKQYYADQIAYLIFISLAKQVLAMDNIAKLFKLQQQTYTTETAYSYFCEEMESTLNAFITGEDLPTAPEELPFPKKVLRSVVISVAHIIFLKNCFEVLDQDYSGRISN